MLRTIFLLLCLIPICGFAQQTEVSGNVTASDGPLMGVSVIEKGTTNGTTTDFKGNYAIAVKNGATLVFSYLGFKTQEVGVSISNLDITMEEDASQLDEVVVKGFENVIGQARRRAESVQSIPESVVTFTAKDIETKGISNVQTFADQIPNVNFTTSQNVGNNFITVRGISQIRNGDAPIAFVIDGVTLPDANLLNQELFDVALIEVVKGPQGALYGKNAIAGAINIVTNEPTNTFRNKIKVGYGNGNLVQAQLSSTGPLVKDKLFYRVSGSFKKGDGLLNNITLNAAPDFMQDLTLRAQLKANLSPKVSATLTGQIIDAEAGAVYYAGPTTPGQAKIAPDDYANLAIQTDQRGVGTLNGTYGNLKVNFNLDKVKITSLTTYNKAERNAFGDLDFTAADVLRQNQDSNTETFNQEIRLGSVSNSESKVNWDVGAFYQNLDKLLLTEGTADFGFFAPPFEPSGVQSPLAVGDFTNNYKTFAVFGFMDFKVSDKLTLSAGLRYDNDNISQDNRSEGTNPSRVDTQLQPKLSVAFQATENMLMYANYGKGYRTGGFNQGTTVRYDTSFNPEITDSYEVGLKNSYWDNRFILNLAGYYTDFTDQQLYALVINGGESQILIGNFNVPESRSVGFEADMRIRATNWLDVLASYGVSKSVIERGTSTVSTGANETIDVSGNATPLVPQDSYSLGLESRFDITDKVAFNGNVNVKGTGEMYWHEDNAAVSPRYSLLNTRLNFTFDQFTVGLWGTNLTDTQYITEFFDQTFSNGGSDLAWLGQPAAYGASLSYKF